MPMIIAAPKSVGLAVLLTFLFGPLGMFYSTIAGALIMIVLSIVLAFFTLGLSLCLTWPVSIIWGAAAAASANNRVMVR